MRLSDDSRPINLSLKQSEREHLNNQDYLEKLLQQEESTVRSSQLQQQQTCYLKCLAALGSFCSPFVFCCPCCCCLNYPVHEQPTSTTGLLKRFGRFKGYTKQGINIINPITESVLSVSTRTKTLQLRQTAISSDNIQFGVETILFYRIVEPSHLLFRLGTEMEEVRMCVMEIGKGVVRYLVGKYELQDVIEKREEIGHWLVEQLNEELKIWGLYIEKANIKEIQVDKGLAQIISEVTKTKRRAEALIINNKAEVEVAKCLKQICEVLESDAAMQIRFLNAIQSILQTQNQKIMVIKLQNSP